MFFLKYRKEVGHIDLLSKFAYIEVPEEDAKRVAAEQELTRIEDELKTKMMEIRS